MLYEMLNKIFHYFEFRLQHFHVYHYFSHNWKMLTKSIFKLHKSILSVLDYSFYCVVFVLNLWVLDKNQNSL